MKRSACEYCWDCFDLLLYVTQTNLVGVSLLEILFFWDNKTSQWISRILEQITFDYRISQVLNS